MSVRPIAAYSFLPWAREGLGTFIRQPDFDPAVLVRGSIDVELRLSGDRVGGGTFSEPLPPRVVQLYGPGDIIGIEARAIVRSEPRNWITNFESNYMPFVEFYDEDFPWRYTPAAASADGKRLRPWVTVIVLEESEIPAQGASGRDRPLPFVQIADPGRAFPAADQLWAWAHVHVNGSFTADPADAAAVAAELADTIRADRDLAYSRVLCPRILKPDTAYHAFLVPTFETGRLAGLGRDPALAPFATESAWSIYPGREDVDLFPYYHRWYFRTGTVGDFEYLVRLLQPRTVDPRVGRRDMDVQAPGANLPGIPELGGILRLGGALRAPLITLSVQAREEYDRFEQWGSPYPHRFQTALASLVNLANDYGGTDPATANTASGLEEIEDDEDPVIVPPLYGRWHAQTQRLVDSDGDPARQRWVHELGLDPRFRVAAGFGTRVVQTNQEQYMEASWRQVGKVLEANQKIRFGQMAKITTLVWHARELEPLRRQSAARYLSLIAPVQRRVVVGGVTVHHQIRQSTLPAAALSKPFRQARRPRARLERLAGYDAAHPREALLPRMALPDGDDGKVSAAPPKTVSPQLPTGRQFADRFVPRGFLAPLLRALIDRPALRTWLVVAASILLLLVFAIAPASAIVLAVLIGAAAAWIVRALPRAAAATALDPDTRTPESVDRMPASPNFRIGPAQPGAAPQIGGTVDSAEARRFKFALRNAYTVDVAERAIPRVERQPIEVGAIAEATVQPLHPARTVPARVLGSVRIPARIAEKLPPTFDEIMVYPEIDQPMYEPLKEISSELFLPNLQLIENNSITLLETNQKFIESYMVGLNHEFARELLWREYPTDQRGSYFRQFWDVSDFLAEAGADLQALRERLRDIPELHRWPTDTELGAHDHREQQGDKEDEVVLVIRGELLKKYPTAVIYAHRAEWQRTAGAVDKSKPRRPVTLTDAQALDPPKDLVKTPLYEAKVDPDLYLFGFDLTAERARGGQSVDGEEDPGWFFVVEERPGEPRFGLDLPRTGPPPLALHTWNDLSWTDVLNAYTPGDFLRIGETSRMLTDPGSGSDDKVQYDDDRNYLWRADTDAAELAYILYQVPVRIAVHAAEMLKQAV
ncbi:MAG TPA: hypothetical protein VFK57_19055 [Vicinamibacterales bacterium]|nr:hypothetical protein [Vicinamibacterales bacterium]